MVQLNSSQLVKLIGKAGAATSKRECLESGKGSAISITGTNTIPTYAI